MRLKLILIVDTFFRGGEEWHRQGVGILHAFDVVFVFLGSKVYLRLRIIRLRDAFLYNLRTQNEKG